jgi:hypothetical protein
VLANQGTMAGQFNSIETGENELRSLTPSSLLRVLRSDGSLVLDWSIAQSKPIVDRQLAYLLTDALSDGSSRGPSLGQPDSLEIGRPAAVKVGQSQGRDAAWTVGYTPQVVIGVWMATSQAEDEGLQVELSEGLWQALMQFTLSEEPIVDFTMPEGISTLKVCDPSGLLASDFCPSIVQEVFLSGHEPTQMDNLYRKYQLNRQNGLLATVFTPPELIEEVVFLVVPSQAEDWAMRAGVPFPPDSYDATYLVQPESESVHITEPKLSAFIKGIVDITGSAGGDGFKNYRIQVGKGLNPHQWIQIGEVYPSPVQDGVLALWDTNGLDGVYIIQLLVERENQRTDRAMIQVTIDNTDPEIIIHTPTDGERIITSIGDSVMIQTEVSDNLFVQQVEFFLDGELEYTLYKPPYVVLWPARLGEHHLLIKAQDQAGNVRDTTISFTIGQ